MQHIRNAVQQFLKTQPPARIIAIGFALLILCGAALLMLPFSVHPGVHITPLNALFTSTSAVCVTGLVVVDTGDTFSLFGQLVIAVLIQIGGLGVASIGMGLALVTGRRISLKGRSLVREALNVENLNGMVKLVRAVLLMTVLCEAAGAVLSFPAFARDHMPLRAVWLSIFHSIASFNNAGFDALGGGTSLIPYRDDLLLNIVTDALVIVGGIGFMVILDVGRCRGNFRKMSFHTKVVLSTTAVLLFGGMALARYGVSLPAFGAAEGSNPLMRSAAFGAVTFAFYNFFGSVGILAPLGEAASSKRAARRGVLLGTALLLLIAYSVLLAVMAVPETADAELPMLALAYGLSRPLGYVYGILLLLCMYGSALSMTVAITTYASARSERVEKRRGWFILALGALGYAASSVGFGDLISVVYPVFGYCSSVFIVCLLVHAAQTRKKEYKFFENSGTKEEEISS